MKTIKIVADSSANLLSLEKTEFAAAPLKVITDTREFADDAMLDVDAMVSWFESYKGKSKTSCPNPSDWLEAFGDADEIYCVTITSGLSGSYNAACIAKQMYETENRGKQVCVIDSLSAGPELADRSGFHAAVSEKFCCQRQSIPGRGKDHRCSGDPGRGQSQRSGNAGADP